MSNQEKQREKDRIKDTQNSLLQALGNLYSEHRSTFDFIKYALDALFKFVIVATITYLGFYFYSTGLPISRFSEFESIGLLFQAFILTFIIILFIFILVGSAGILINKAVYSRLYLEIYRREVQLKCRPLDYLCVLTAFTSTLLILTYGIYILSLPSDIFFLLSIVIAAIMANIIISSCEGNSGIKSEECKCKKYREIIDRLKLEGAKIYYLALVYILFAFSAFIIASIINNKLDRPAFICALLIATFLNFVAASSIRLYLTLCLSAIFILFMRFEPIIWYPLHVVKLGLFTADLYLMDRHMCEELKKFYKSKQNCSCDSKDANVMVCKNIDIMLSTPNAYYVSIGPKQCKKDNKECKSDSTTNSDAGKGRKYIEVPRKYVKYIVYQDTKPILNFYNDYKHLFQTQPVSSSR